MGPQISEFHETLEGQLGLHFSDLQIFCGCPEGHIYNECHRIIEFHLSEIKSAEKRISKRYSFAEGTVSGYF